MIRSEIWSGLALSVLSGCLLTVGFPSQQIYPLSWVALIPLLFALRGKSVGWAFALGYVCGLVHNFTVLFWIRYVIHHYGGLPLAVAILILLLLCAYLGLYQACFAVFVRKWEAHPLLLAFCLPCAWVGLEFLRACALTGFPWANLGYTQTPLLELVQCADITGVYGISWLVVFGNTALLAFLTARKALVSLVIFAVCIVAAIIYGDSRLKALREVQQEAEALNVGVIQGNIDQSQKWNPAFQQETLRRYRELSLGAVSGTPRPHLLVWPETSAPFLYGVDERLTAQLDGLFREAATPVLFGSPAVIRLDGEVRFQNKAYLVDGDARTLGEYAKQHLVPFGEYVPLGKLLFFVGRLVEFAGDFVPGTDISPIPFNSQALGILICYEGIFPYLSRRAIQNGATAFVNITNDAWYGPTSAPYQHMEIARWRAIEFRRPLIRAANTGISTVVDVTGRLCGTIPLNEQGFLVCRVQPADVPTFYCKWGDLFSWLCVVMTGAGSLFATFRKNPTEDVL